MGVDAEGYGPALDRARGHVDRWLASLDERRVPPEQDIDQVLATADAKLPDEATDPAEVTDLLARTVEPGLMAMPSGRFYGWVIGGAMPAALAADWMVSGWDQNTGMRYATPGTVAVEEIAGAWLLDLLGLPATADVGFVTGGTMANFTGLAAGRQHVLTEAGWDLNRHGLQGAPKVTVIVGEERHITVDLALRYLGLGEPTAVPSDDQGRIRVDALAAALDAVDGPCIVALQAGNLHSGAFDDFAAAIPLAHQKGAWVHVDGAFGLWAAASPAYSHLTEGVDLADSWGTDAHKTLNTPYDCGIAIVAHPRPLRAAMGTHASYLINASEQGDPFDKAPELSRRARGVPVWAALRSLGRSGVVALVDRLAGHARRFADELGALDGVEVVHDVVFTQVCLSFGSDERTHEVTERLIAEGTVWMSGSHWHGRDVLRISVSNWSTDDGDVTRSIEAVRRAAG